MSLYSVTKIAEETGIDRRTLKKRLEILSPIKEGRSHLYDTKQAYPLIYGGYKDDGEIDLEYERGRLTRSQADGQEMKNQVIRKELAPIRLVEFALENAASQMVSIFQAIPLKVKRMLPHMKATEIEVIKREVVKAQNAASKMQIDWDSYEAKELTKEYSK